MTRFVSFIQTRLTMNTPVYL